MDEQEHRAAIEEIKLLKARYFRFMDTKQWNALEGLFAPDLVMDSTESTGTYDPSLLWHGAGVYVTALAPILQPLVTVHHGHMPEIEIISPTTATGIWAFEDRLWAPEANTLGWRFMHGHGHYHETYIRLDGGWRIQTLKITRLRTEFL